VRAFAADDRSNGATVKVVPGQRVVVTLASTLWRFQPVPLGGVVDVAVAPVVRPGTGCSHIPGTGCGTLSATFVARHAGSTVLRAHRDACGEARACPPAKQNWSLTVVVGPR